MSRPGFWRRIITLEPLVSYVGSPLNRHAVESLTAYDAWEWDT